MVSWKKARSGETVPIYNDLCLHSLMNPIVEAEKWVSHRASDLVGDTVVFVLGVAGGYHLQALSKAMPDCNVIGLDSEKTFVEQALSKGLFAWHISNVDDFLSNSDLVANLLQPYSVISYGPSHRAEPKIYSRIEQFLLAKDIIDFRTHANLRPELRSWISAFSTDDEIVSIHSLCQSNHSSDPVTSNQGRLWHVLRELVV
jgi:trans-aconitate methyltransferase